MTNDSQRIIAIAVTVGLFLLILDLVRRRRLMERYALLWLFASVVLLVLAAWRGLLTTLAYKVGIHYPPSALFVVAIGLGLVLMIHFSLAVSRLADQNTVLAQRLAILQHRLDEAERLTNSASTTREDDLAAAHTPSDRQSSPRKHLSPTG